MAEEFLDEEDCLPNINAVTLAGKVVSAEKVVGKSVGLAFMVEYLKHWGAERVQKIPIQCFCSGADRIEKLGWLKPDVIVLVSGQVDGKGGVYALQVQDLSK